MKNNKMAIKKECCTKKELRNVKICVRVTKSMSEFMKANKLSPSMVMVSALEELGLNSK